MHTCINSFSLRASNFPILHMTNDPSKPGILFKLHVFQKPAIYHIMTTLISDADFLKIDQQLAEPFTEDMTNSKTNISHAQDSVTDPTLMKQTLKIELSATPSHENKGERHEDLNPHMDPIHTIITLLYDIIKHLKDVTNSQHSLSQQLHISSQQVERMQQASTQANISQRSKEKKPENRLCFRCNKVGHIAKKCRTRLLQKQQCQNTRQHKPSRKQSFNRNRDCQISRNIRYNPSTYHARHNGQTTSQRSKHTSSQTISIPRHKIQSSGFPNTETSLLHNSSQKPSLNEMTNHED